jgi:hypothetical protein
MPCAPGPSGRHSRAKALAAEHRLPLLSSIVYDESAHCTQVGVLVRLWSEAPAMYDEFKGLEWTWQSVDEAMPKASVGRSHGRYSVFHLGLRVFTHWRRLGRGTSCALWLVSHLAAGSPRVAQ